MPDRNALLHRYLPELLELELILRRGGDLLRSSVLHIVDMPSLHRFDIEGLPIHGITLGSEAADAPTVGFFGGVHGVERIGAQIVLSYLRTTVERARWDPLFREQLQRVRLVFMPMVNPGGIWMRTRSNPNGVDLMRNAPIDATGDSTGDSPAKVPWLIGGHRIGPWLPWYRGKYGAPMQPEATTMIEFVRRELLRAPFSTSFDVHSGFGTTDRLWFSYARTHRPMDHLAEIRALELLFDRTHPYHHQYVIEPQSVNYTTHGDLWDFLYDESLANGTGHLFLPFTLELGSWLWVKKNPWQLLRLFGMFNPILHHRLKRVLRQHTVLFDFTIRAAANRENWLPTGAWREQLTREAMQHWFISQGQ